MTDKKTVAIKMVGSNAPTRNIDIIPGTTARDILNEIGLTPGGHQLSDARNVDVIFHPDDPVFGAVDHGGVLYASSAVVAGGV